MPPKQRKSYPLAFQLEAMKIYKNEVAQYGKCNITRLADKFGVKRSTIYDWIDKMPKIEKASASQLIKTRLTRKLVRPSNPKFVELDDLLKNWVMNQNTKGLVVKVSFFNAYCRISTSQDMH